MSSDTGSIDLSFLSSDVKNQLAQAKDVLQQAETLRATLPSISDKEAKEKIESTITALLNIAERINNNANTVYTSANSTISSSGFARWKKRDE